MITIRSFTNQMEASFEVSFLQANGFDAVLLDESSFQWAYAGTAIPIRLQVPEEQAQRAIQCLKSFHSSETTSGDAA